MTSQGGLAGASEYSDAQIIAAISAALRASDMPSVVGLLKMLALQNPREAEILLAGIELIGGVS